MLTEARANEILRIGGRSGDQGDAGDYGSASYQKPEVTERALAKAQGRENNPRKRMDKPEVKNLAKRAKVGDQMEKWWT